jgi:hypothetical protein
MQSGRSRWRMDDVLFAPNASIDARVHELFSAPEPPSPEDVRVLLAQFQANAAQASASMHRAALYLFGSWISVVLLGTGLIERAEVFGLSLRAIDTLLILGPPVAGAFSYFLLLSYGTSNHLIVAIASVYRHHLPGVHELGLHYYLMPPTLSTMENLLVGRASSRWLNLIQVGWLHTLTGLVFLGSLGTLVHASYFLFLSQRGLVISSLLSVALGVILWLRGLAAFVTAYQASGD